MERCHPHPHRRSMRVQKLADFAGTGPRCLLPCKTLLFERCLNVLFESARDEMNQFRERRLTHRCLRPARFKIRDLVVRNRHRRQSKASQQRDKSCGDPHCCPRCRADDRLEAISLDFRKVVNEAEPADIIHEGLISAAPLKIRSTYEHVQLPAIPHRAAVYTHAYAIIPSYERVRSCRHCCNSFSVRHAPSSPAHCSYAAERTSRVCGHRR